MNMQLETLLVEAEGRYLNEDESAELRGFAQSIDRRLQAMRAVEQAEEEIVSRVVADLLGAHPQFESRHAMAREKAARDITLVLRYCALAMVRDDLRLLEERLLYWLATILQATSDVGSLDTTFRSLCLRSEEVLDEATIALLAPFLRRTHEIVTTPTKRSGAGQ